MWDELIMYAYMVWARVVKLIDINVYTTENLLKNFDETWGVRNVLCKLGKMKITWN